MNSKEKRNHNLDIVKAICAFMVVTIHCPSIFLPPYIEASTRIAVPMFFAISGYFYNKPTFSNTCRKISKMLILLTVTELFYALMYIIGGQADKVKAAIDNGIVNILLGRFILWLPGWFLLVLAYTYALAYIIERFRINPLFLILVSSILLTFQWINPDVTNSNMKFLRGLPYFIIGMLIKRYEAKLRIIPYKIYVSLSVVFEILVLAEKYFRIQGNRSTGSTIIYAGTIPLMVSLFCIALFHKTFNAPFLIFTGRYLSMYIYCMHIAVMSVLSRLGLKYESLWLCVTSITVTSVIYFTLRTVKTVFNHVLELPTQLDALYGLDTANPILNTTLPIYHVSENSIRHETNYVFSGTEQDDINESESLYDNREYKVS